MDDKINGHKKKIYLHFVRVYSCDIFLICYSIQEKNEDKFLLKALWLVSLSKRRVERSPKSELVTICCEKNWSKLKSKIDTNEFTQKNWRKKKNFPLWNATFGQEWFWMIQLIEQCENGKWLNESDIKLN